MTKQQTPQEANGGSGATSASAVDAAYARRRQHVIWYGVAVVLVLVVVGVIQIFR